MASGPVLCIRNSFAFTPAAQVRSDSFSMVEDLDRCRHRADLDQLVNQVIGHAVVTAVEHHVVIDVDLRLGPFT